MQHHPGLPPLLGTGFFFCLWFPFVAPRAFPDDGPAFFVSHMTEREASGFVIR